MLLLMERRNKWKWLSLIGAKCMNQFPLSVAEKSLSFVIESQTISCPIKARVTQYISNVKEQCGGGRKKRNYVSPIIQQVGVYISRFPRKDALLWVGGCAWHYLSEKAPIYPAKCIKLSSPCNCVGHVSTLRSWVESSLRFFWWRRCLRSPLFSRATSVFVTPGGRAHSANKKLMNACHSPAKTTPPAPTFSTATSRCTEAGGRRPHPHLRVT